MPRMDTHCEVALPPPKLMDGSLNSTSFMSVEVDSSIFLVVTRRVEVSPLTVMFCNSCLCSAGKSSAWA